ncbi:MAG: hypothetical protein ACRD2T_01195, partial [Thermoanaerobaculia bacterium]
MAAAVSVLFLGAGPAGSAVVIDNGDPGTSSVGTWRLSTNSQPYGGDAVYGRRTGSYTFAAQLTPGRYDVSLYWTAQEGLSGR